MKKIVHLCLAAFYIDNYSYQENMLPKFHKAMGFKVEIIASLLSFDKNGNPCYLSLSQPYQNEYDIKVTRLEFKKPKKIYKILRRYRGTYEALEKAAPDILFIHGCQFLDVNLVVKYLKKHRNVQVFVDNHSDFSNSGRNWLSRNILHKLLWRHTANKIEPFTTMFWGVLPARVDWLKDLYKLPQSKCDLLVMGADDDKVVEAKDPSLRKEIRSKYNISDNDFLVMTGGKIDSAKKQTLLLMEAISQITNHPNVKLIVFGSVTPDMKEAVESRCDQNRVQYIGWIESKEAYKYFAAADLVVFPGRHSVFWEQVVGLGIPLICKYWEGTTHVDLGGNVRFLKNDSVKEIQGEILNLIEHPDVYQNMKEIAEKKGMETFSYRMIAKKAIGLK